MNGYVCLVRNRGCLITARLLALDEQVRVRCFNCTPGDVRCIAISAWFTERNLIEDLENTWIQDIENQLSHSQRVFFLTEEILRERNLSVGTSAIELEDRWIQNRFLEPDGQITLLPRTTDRRPTRRGVSPALRLKILQRDGFKCGHCGRDAENDGVSLEVDHIQPVSKGGTDDEDNLWTLCREHNRKKSNRL